MTASEQDLVLVLYLSAADDRTVKLSIALSEIQRVLWNALVLELFFFFFTYLFY